MPVSVIRKPADCFSLIYENSARIPSMSDRTRIGVIICHRYHTCAGGKCLRALRSREGAFEIYRGREIELAGYTTCGGCPGGNIEYAPEEMQKNGVEAVHLATGLLVGYPPCPYVGYFRQFIESRYGMKVVFGTHPIPEKYYRIHAALGTWSDPAWQDILKPTLADETIRLSYD
jgi:predicted metal-binding protein